MSFDLHIVTKPNDLPATISLRRGKNGVTCYVSVRLDTLRAIGGADKSGYDVLIGRDDDAGKMRVRVNKDGRATGRRMRGVLIFNLGRVAGFPDQECDKQRCDAKAIGADTIEIALPQWGALPAADEVADEEPVAPARAAPVHTPAVGNGVPQKSGSGPKVLKDGIALDLTFDDESISFKKKTMDLTTRQAAIAAALLRAMPNHVGRDFLCKNLLAEIPAHTREVSLDLIFRDLEKALSGVGLELKITKGVGAAICIAGAK